MNLCGDLFHLMGQGHQGLKPTPRMTDVSRSTPHHCVTKGLFIEVPLPHTACPAIKKKLQDIVKGKNQSSKRQKKIRNRLTYYSNVKMNRSEI